MIKKILVVSLLFSGVALGGCQSQIQSDLTQINSALTTGAALAPSLCQDVAVAGALVDAAATAAAVSTASPVKARTVTNVNNATAEANSACGVLVTATTSAATSAAQ